MMFLARSVFRFNYTRIYIYLFFPFIRLLPGAPDVTPSFCRFYRARHKRRDEAQNHRIRQNFGYGTERDDNNSVYNFQIVRLLFQGIIIVVCLLFTYICFAIFAVINFRLYYFLFFYSCLMKCLNTWKRPQQFKLIVFFVNLDSGENSIEPPARKTSQNLLLYIYIYKRICKSSLQFSRCWKRVSHRDIISKNNTTYFSDLSFFISYETSHQAVETKQRCQLSINKLPKR